MTKPFHDALLLEGQMGQAFGGLLFSSNVREISLYALTGLLTCEAIDVLACVE